MSNLKEELAELRVITERVVATLGKERMCLEEIIMCSLSEKSLVDDEMKRCRECAEKYPVDNKRCNLIERIIHGHHDLKYNLKELAAELFIINKDREGSNE